MWQIQQQAQALYPLLLHLRAAVSAAAAAIVEGSSEAKDDEAAGVGALAVSSSEAEGARLPRTVESMNGAEGDSEGVGTNLAVAGKGTKQHRNTHALTVLRRIKCKLEGKDKLLGKEREAKQSVVEQVETVIKQACSLDNLAELYEGWAAWI